MNNTKERRLFLDKDGLEILNRLSNEPIFKDLKHSDIFSICLILGKKQKVRTKMNNVIDFIRESTINNSNLKYLMMAIAVEETKNLEIITNKNEYFKICEEYARTGLDILEKYYVQDSKGILDKLDTEALEFFDEYMDKKIE